MPCFGGFLIVMMEIKESFVEHECMRARGKNNGKAADIGGPASGQEVGSERDSFICTVSSTLLLLL